MKGRTQMEDRAVGSTSPKRSDTLEGEAASRPGMTMAAAVGEAVTLMTQSPGHRYLFLGDLDWTVLPPLMLGQFRLFRAQGRVVGLVLWAQVSDEVDARLTAGVARLSPLDWKSGETLWVVDVVAPFGGAERMIDDLASTALAGKRFKHWGTDADGQRVVKVRE